MSQSPRSESHDLLGRIWKRLGIDQWADWLNLSKATLYKWQERAAKDEELPFEPSGRLNPFDRVEQIVAKLRSEGQGDLLEELADWFMRLFGQTTFSQEDIEEMKAILDKSRKRKRA